MKAILALNDGEEGVPFFRKKSKNISLYKEPEKVYKDFDDIKAMILIMGFQ